MILVQKGFGLQNLVEKDFDQQILVQKGFDQQILVQKGFVEASNYQRVLRNIWCEAPPIFIQF